MKEVQERKSNEKNDKSIKKMDFPWTWCVHALKATFGFEVTVRDASPIVPIEG